MVQKGPFYYHTLAALSILACLSVPGPGFGAAQSAHSDNTSSGRHPLPASDLAIMHRYGTSATSAVPALIEGLHSRDPGIRKNAAFTLGELGSDAGPALNDLADVLHTDPDRQVRRNAAFALGEIGPAAIPVLIKALYNENAHVRKFVAAALVRIGEPAVKPLISELGGTSAIARRNAASILGRIGPDAKDTLPGLETILEQFAGREQLTEKEKAFRWTVRQAVRKIKQVSVGDLIKCLNDKDVILRVKAAKTLGNMKTKAAPAVPALISCLADARAAVRQEAAFALARIGDPSIPELTRALEHSSPQIRKNAAFSLGEMGPQAAAAREPLKKLLNDENKSVRWCAAAAIKKINRDDSPGDMPKQR